MPNYNDESSESKAVETTPYVMTPLPAYQSKYSGFGFVKTVAGITMFFSIIGVLSGLSALSDSGSYGMILLAGAWSLLVFALIPWTLVKIGQHQKNHHERVERHLQQTYFDNGQV